MQAIFSVIVPFFALVLAGYVAAHRRWLPEASIPGLNVFVLYFALPCLLFRFGANTPLLELLHPTILAVYLMSAVTIVFVTIRATLGPRIHLQAPPGPGHAQPPCRPRRAQALAPSPSTVRPLDGPCPGSAPHGGQGNLERPGVSLKDAAFGALVAAFPNTGFMGMPLLVALLGKAAAGPVICAVLVDILFTSSLCIALAQLHGSSGGLRPALAQALRGTLSNPLPWSIVAGMISSASGYRLAGPLDVMTRMMADAASPVALFTIGAVLWRAGQHVHTRTPVALFLPVALIKLFMHPLLVFGLGTAAQALGAPLSPFQLLVLTLAAALPSASNVSLLAERYGADNGRVARIILASTVLAFISFSLLTWFVGVKPTG